MLRLRLKNPVPNGLAHHQLSQGRRREGNAEILKNTRHPLATAKSVTIDMEYDADAEIFVTYVKELHRISTFGETELSALQNTAEMIRGYIKSMEANHKRIPLTAHRLAELKQQVGLA